MELNGRTRGRCRTVAVVRHKPHKPELDAEPLQRGPNSNMEYLETRPKEGAEAETERGR